MKKVNLLAIIMAGVFTASCNGGGSSDNNRPSTSPINPTNCSTTDGCNYILPNGQWESISSTSLSVTGTGQSVSFTSGESFIMITMPVLSSSSKSLSSIAVVSSRPVNEVCNPLNQNHNFVIVNGTCQLLPDGQNYAIITIPGDAFINGNYSVYTSINGSWSSFNSYTNPNWTILPNNATPPIRLTNESATYYNGNNTIYNTSLINSITSTHSFPDGTNMPYAGLSSFNKINYWANTTTIDIDYSNALTFCEIGGGIYGFSWCDQFPSEWFPTGVSPVSADSALIVGSDGYIYASCNETSTVIFTKLTALGNGNVAINNVVRKDPITSISGSTYLSTNIYTITKSNNSILQITGTLSNPESDKFVSNLCSLYQ